MTIEQIFTVAGFVLAAAVAAAVAVFIGHQILRLARAIGRITEVVATIVGRILRLALIGGLAIGLVAGAIWWAIQPTASAAPSTPTPTAPLPTREIPTSRVGLLVMSDEEAQPYGEGFKFVSSSDNSLCVLRKVSYQDYLVADCD